MLKTVLIVAAVVIGLGAVAVLAKRAYDENERSAAMGLAVDQSAPPLYVPTQSAAVDDMWSADAQRAAAIDWDSGRAANDTFVNIRSYARPTDRSVYAGGEGPLRYGEGRFQERLMPKPDTKALSEKRFTDWRRSGLGLESGTMMLPGPGQTEEYDFLDKTTGGLVTDTVKRAYDRSKAFDEPVFPTSSFDQAIVEEPANIVSAESGMGLRHQTILTSRRNVSHDLRGDLPPGSIPDAFWCTGDASLAAPAGASLPSLGPFAIAHPSKESSSYYAQVGGGTTQ